MSSSSAITLIGGIGSLVYNGYDLRDSYKHRKQLKESAEKLGQAVQDLHLEPELQAEIAPSAEKSVERAYSRAKGAVANIGSDVCNCLSASVNIITSGLEAAGAENTILDGLQKIGTKFGYATAGLSDVFNSCIQGVECVKAVKQWWKQTDSQSAKIYGWHAINQGVSTVVTFGRAASYFVSVPGVTVSLGVGVVAPALLVAVGGGVFAVTSDYFCKSRMKAAQMDDPSNVPAILRRIEKQPSQSKELFETYIERKKEATLVSSPSKFPLCASKSEDVFAVDMPASPTDDSAISFMREEDAAPQDDGYALPGVPDEDS